MSQGNSLIRTWGSCIYVLGGHAALHTLTQMVFSTLCAGMLSCFWLFADLWTVACQTALVFYRCLKNQKRFSLCIIFDSLAVIPSSFVLLIFLVLLKLCLFCLPLVHTSWSPPPNSFSFYMEGKPALPLKPSIPYKCFAVCEFLSLLPSPLDCKLLTGRDYVVRIFSCLFVFWHSLYISSSSI